MKKRIWNIFVPDANQVFYNLFNEATANNMAIANTLYEALGVGTAADRKPLFNQISRLKTTSSEIKQRIFAASSNAFVSPFERDDMIALATAVDKVSNMIDIVARRINLYVEHGITPYAKELAGVIADCCREMERSIEMLDNLKQADLITASCNTIKNYESYADNLYNKAIAQLLAQEQDTLEVIKHTEILDSLERATDKCEHVTKVLETILIKNS